MYGSRFTRRKSNNERRNNRLSLTQIEKKLDTVTDLLLQTQAQEIRLSNAKRSELNEKKDKNIQMWLTPLISAIIYSCVCKNRLKIKETNNA